MTYEVALAKFKAFGCEKCSDMEDRILEALEKQIPKKPKVSHLGFDICPMCKSHEVRSTYGSRQDYCPYCGQRIDWSEVE